VGDRDVAQDLTEGIGSKRRCRFARRSRGRRRRPENGREHSGFNAVGRQLAGALKLYVQQHGTNVAGRKIELIVRDDGGVADNARRIVQEMIVNQKVELIGIGKRRRRWRSRRS